MEFTKDIHFTSNLKGNETVGITYSGNLYKNGSESVSIVYGFGENWEHTTEKEMEKSEAGFTTEIEIKGNYDTFNFCFRNGNYEWDNNQSFNYISGISPTDPLETTQTFEGNEVESNLSTDFIMEILNSLLEENENSSEAVSAETNKQQILDEILLENTAPVENSVYVEDFDMDALIDNILNPVINCTTSENVETASVLGEAENIELISEETKNGEIESGLGENTFSFEGITGGIETKNIGTVAAEVSQNVGGVATEIANEGINDSGSNNDVTIEDVMSENTGLVPAQENTYLVSPRKLRKFYLIQKKIKLAIYKLVVAIPKLLSGTFDEENN